MKLFLNIFCLLVLSLHVCAEIDGAQVGASTNVDANPEALEGVTVDEHFGQQIDLSLKVTNEDGKSVELGSFFKQGRPVVINMVYYSCGGTCGALINGTFQTLKEVNWKPGTDFEILNISFEPKEPHILAAESKKNYLRQYEHDGQGIHFLTAPAETSTKLAQQLGFSYKWVPSKSNPEMGDYSHPSVTHILTENGILSRYLYGISFPERDYKFALTEAGEGKVGSFAERILVFCFQYDKERGKYVKNSMRVMSLGGLIVLIVLGTFLGVLWKNEFKKNKDSKTV